MLPAGSKNAAKLDIPAPKSTTAWALSESEFAEVPGLIRHYWGPGLADCGAGHAVCHQLVHAYQVRTIRPFDVVLLQISTIQCQMSELMELILLGIDEH